MKKLYLAALILTVPTAVSAHTRWFAPTDLEPYVAAEPTSFYLTIWAIVAAAIVAVGILFERQGWFRFSFLELKEPHVFERAASTFTMVSGTFFLIAGTHHYLFSPNLTADGGIPMTIVVIQILVGLAYLLGIFPRLASLVLAMLWTTVFYYAGWVAALEDIWVLSTALFILFMGNDYFSIVSFSVLRSTFAPYKRYGLSILRLGTGTTLLVLGFSEKIIAPEFGVNFLAQYPWNFMSILGFNYSDYLFTLSAGAVESLFGLIFILGIVTRLNALVVAIVFTTPLFILGPIELAGHLPHFAAVVLLLLFGNGGHFTFFSDKKYK